MTTEFELPARYAALAEEAAELARRVAPFAGEAGDSTALDPRLVAELAASGLCAVAVPAPWGGREDEVDPVAVCVVREALMPASGHLDALFALQGIGSYAVALAGTDEQRSAWLPRVAAAEALAALALTEPNAGSDLRAIETRIEEHGDELVLTGEKSFISNAGVAAFYGVLARDGDTYSLVLVPGDLPGIRVRRGGDLISAHVLGDLAFDGVRLPASARIGGPGQGFELVLATLTVFRASVAAAAVGIAQAALDEAVAHANTRIQFGRPLIRQGQVAALLADSLMEIEMARLLTYRAAARAARRDPRALVEASMAKVAATETAARVTDRAVQVMGRFGLVRGSKVERLYRESRALRIYEGASEVLRGTIARSLETKGGG
jgi:acyl-CoA dehydrogenase